MKSEKVVDGAKDGGDCAKKEGKAETRRPQQQKLSFWDAFAAIKCEGETRRPQLSTIYDGGNLELW